MNDVAQLEASVTELLVATAQLQRRLRAVSNTRQLTWSQVAVMAQLDETGPMTTADLARAEAVKPQSMGGTLAVLEEEGLVERRPHPTDRRQILFALTAAGHETRRQVTLAKHDWLVAAFARLKPADQQTLAAAAGLIRKVSDGG